MPAARLGPPHVDRADVLARRAWAPTCTSRAGPATCSRRSKASRSSSRQADLYAVTGRERDIQRIEADPATDGLRAAGRLPGRGQPPQGHRRGAARGGASGTPLHLLLDDLAGSTLISGFVFIRWLDHLPEMRERLTKAPVASVMADICSGFRTARARCAATVPSSTTRTPRIPGLWPIRPTLSAGTSSTSLPPSPCGAPGASTSGTKADIIGIDAMFRDSAWDPDGRELVVHEYQMLGTADRASGDAALRDRRPTRAALRRVPGCGTERSVDGGHRAPGHAHRGPGSDCATPTAAPTSTTGCAPWPRCPSSPRLCPAEPRIRREHHATRQRRRPGAGRPRRFEAEDELRILSMPRSWSWSATATRDAAVADILRRGRPLDPLLLPALRIQGPAALRAVPPRGRRRGGAPAGQGRRGGQPPRGAARVDRRDPQLRPHRVKAARVSVLGSPAAMKAEGYADEMRHASAVLTAPLEALLRRGRGRRLVPAGRPAADAPLIQSVVWAAAGLNPARDKPSSRAEAARQVRSFCERALGVTPESLTRVRASQCRRTSVRAWRARPATTGRARRPRPAPHRRSRGRAGATRPRRRRPAA